MAGWMRGMWRITLWHPDRDDGTCVYLVPHWQARTEVAARSVALARHADRAAVMNEPAHALQMTVGEVAFTPAVRSQARAAAWVALVQHDAITERGWARSPLDRQHVERDEEWQQEVHAAHHRYRERIIGFGDSIRGVMASVAGTDAAWDLEPYRDGFGRIRWDDVRADIHKAALTHIWHTPFGVVWIDLG